MTAFRPVQPDDYNPVVLSRTGWLGPARPGSPAAGTGKSGNAAAAKPEGSSPRVPLQPCSVDGSDAASATRWEATAVRRFTPLGRALHAGCVLAGAGAGGYGGYALWAWLSGDAFDRAVRLFLP